MKDNWGLLEIIEEVSFKLGYYLLRLLILSIFILSRPISLLFFTKVENWGENWFCSMFVGDSNCLIGDKYE